MAITRIAAVSKDSDEFSGTRDVPVVLATFSQFGLKRFISETVRCFFFLFLRSLYWRDQLRKNSSIFRLTR
jgi:hypothetical protein